MNKSVACAPSTPPMMHEFRSALRSLLLEARSNGLTEAVISAGELHRAVGGYPGAGHRMPACCNAMYEEQRVGDQLLAKPNKGYGASLTIAYRLPRR